MNEAKECEARGETSWTRGGVVRALMIACTSFAIGGVVAYALAHERPPPADADRVTASAPSPPPEPPRPSSRPPATAAELALVAPWKDGFSVGGYTVLRVEGVEDGVFRVVCTKERATVALIVALTAEGGPNPPATTGRFSVYYQTGRAPPDDGLALALALAKAIEANGAASAPPGLGPFKASSGGVEL